MTTFAFLFDVEPERFHTIEAADVEAAGTEAAKVAARAQTQMEGTASFVVWLVPLEDVTIYRSKVTANAAFDVSLTPISPQDALG